jgi:hypothetical protein
VKRLLVLLIVLVGGVAAAALTVPTNATEVNGSTTSQASLNSDLGAIANSAYYQCYLNSQAYLSSDGEQQLSPVSGAGKGQDGSGDHPTATTAFVATYVDTEVGHQIVLDVADTHHVTLTATDLADARADFSEQISQVMSEVLQTSQGQNVRYSCSVTGEPVTGAQVLSTMPSSFVDEQVQFVATASALQEDLAGVGSSPADLQDYFQRHLAEFDTACWTVGVYSSQADAQAAAAQVAFGTPFSQVAAKATQGGPQTCEMLPIIASELPSTAKIASLPTGTVSAPIDVNGSYVLVQITSRTPTAYSTAAPVVAEVVQQAGAKATQAAITAKERRSAVTVDPRYGAWLPYQATVFPPLAPSPSDVLNASANEPAVSSAPASSSSSTGATGG